MRANGSNGNDDMLIAILKALVAKAGGAVHVELADVNAAIRGGELRVRWRGHEDASGLLVTLEPVVTPSQQVTG